MSGFQVSVNESVLMDLAEGSCDTDGELEESRDLHRFAEEPVERLAARILEHQHRLIAVTNEFERSDGPRTLQVIFESIFVRETLDTRAPTIFPQCLATARLRCRYDDRPRGRARVGTGVFEVHSTLLR
jgi:hypothetical protein